MVMHKEKQPTVAQRYSVLAKLCEPDYTAEGKYLRTEIAYVERKMAEGTRLEWIGLHKLGALRHADWVKYHKALRHYEDKLKEYAEDVKIGLLPVKFGVYNGSPEPDENIEVRIHVKNGKIDVNKQPPTRPERIDITKGLSLPGKWPKVGKFTRRNIKITPHVLKAEFSSLGAYDGAVLVNQLVHVHCGPVTHVTYEVHSSNTADETGVVEF